MRSKNPKPSSKFVVSTSSEESSSSDRTMDDSVVICTVTADNPTVSSGRDVGLYAGNKNGGHRGRILLLFEPGRTWVEYSHNLFPKGVMNALKSCPGQLNGNIFEMMRVCEALNQKLRDGGIARQFVADDVLKYYKFKYVKDLKSGYLFSDSARQKFFNFESSGRPWCDHLVMVRGNCMQVPGEPALELIYKNFNEKPNPKDVANTSSLLDVVRREGNELNQVLGDLGIRREKRLNSVVEKVQRTHQKRVMAASSSVYADVIEIPAYAMGTSSSLVRRPRIKKTVPPSEQKAPVKIPSVGTEGVDADVNMAPPLMKQKKEYGKDIQASSKSINLEAGEQEALDLAILDPIRLDTQIRSSISQFYVAWKSAAEVLKLATENRGKPVRQHDAEKAALREQFKQEKLIQAFYIWGLSKEDVDLSLAGKYGGIVFPGDDASPVAEQTPAPLVVDDPTKEGQRAMRILFFNIKNEDRKIHAQLEIDLRHACDELERCKGHNARLEMEKVECA
ncbi:hypothetical protein GIB67_024760, partial [Kingdonia uniflora]